MVQKINPPTDPMNSKLRRPQAAGQTRELLEPEHVSKKQKWLTRLVYVSLVLIALTLFTFLRWSFQNENVIQVNNEPFPVRTVRGRAEANGVVILKIDVCKNVETEGDLRMSFVGKDREIFLPLTKEQSPEGCRIQEVPILIPESMEPGTYKIRFRVTYQLNPLKNNIVDEFSSSEFVIAPHDIKGPVQ